MAATHGPSVQWSAEMRAKLEMLVTRKRLSIKRTALAMDLRPNQVKAARDRFGFKSGGRTGVRTVWTEEQLIDLSRRAGPNPSRKTWKALGAEVKKEPDTVRMAVTRWRLEQKKAGVL